MQQLPALTWENHSKWENCKYSELLLLFTLWTDWHICTLHSGYPNIQQIGTFEHYIQVTQTSNRLTHLHTTFRLPKHLTDRHICTLHSVYPNIWQTVTFAHYIQGTQTSNRLHICTLHSGYPNIWLTGTFAHYTRGTQTSNRQAHLHANLGYPNIWQAAHLHTTFRIPKHIIISQDRDCPDNLSLLI